MRASQSLGKSRDSKTGGKDASATVSGNLQAMLHPNTNKQELMAASRNSSGAKFGSGSKNIIAVDESAQSLVDFDLSESKGGMLALLEKSGISHGGGDLKQTKLSKQGTDSSRSGGPKHDSTLPTGDNKISGMTMGPAATLNKSNSLNKSNGGPEDELAMSMDNTDWNLSQSNISHLFSSKMDSFVNQPSAPSGSARQDPSAAIINKQHRERAST